MRFSIVPEHRAIRIEHDHGIIERVIGALEYADGQHDAQLARHAPKMLHRRMPFQRPGEFEVPGQVVLAKIRRLEQLLQEDHLRAAAGRLANQLFAARDIRVAIPTARHLRGRYRYCAH